MVSGIQSCEFMLTVPVILSYDHFVEVEKMEIRIDKMIYSKEVLLKTAYSFLDKVYLHLSQDSTSWIISWSSKNGAVMNPAAFENELIEQQLRYQLVQKTTEIRKLMLARAYASTMIDVTKIADVSISQTTEPGNHQTNISDASQEDILKGWFDANN